MNKSPAGTLHYRKISENPIQHLIQYISILVVVLSASTDSLKMALVTGWQLSILLKMINFGFFIGEYLLNSLKDEVLSD